MSVMGRCRAIAHRIVMPTRATHISLPLPLLLLIATAGLASTSHYLSLRSAASVQGTQTVFGPEVMEAVNGTQQHTEQFGINFDSTRQYRVRIQNGDSDGSQKPDSVTLSFNGYVIATTADLAGQTQIFRIVQARPENVFHATVRRASGTGLIRVTMFSDPSPMFTVFGPQAYTLPSTGTHAFSHNFSIPGSAKPPFRIHLTNGTNTATNTVTSGSISLNGTVVVDSTVINSGLRSLAKEVTLLSQDSVAVSLTGNANAVFKI